MKITIVTVAFKLAEATKKLFESATSTKHEVSWELFLHSTDPAVVEVCEEISKSQNVRYHAYGVNRGLSKSWNEGMISGYADGADVVLIINDDVVMSPGDVDKLAECALEWRGCYMITCQGFNVSEQQSASIGWSCFAINPVALDKVGMFDQNYFPIYFEDCDYARRAELLGLKPRHCDTTNVQHGGSATLRGGHSPAHNENFMGNRDYYLRKWGGEPGKERFNFPFNNGQMGVFISQEQRHHPYLNYRRVNPVADPVRLDIGCGEAPRKGFIGVDRYVESASVWCDMWDINYPADSVDEIYSSHALEHVEKAKVVSTLLEWKRIIKPGGKITIRVPDLIWCCENFLKNPDDGWQLATLYGHQAHDGEYHLTGFTKAFMEKYLGEAGLIITKYEELETHGQKTMSFEVTK